MPQTAHVTGDGNTVVQIAGDHNTVVLGRAFLTLTRFDSQRRITHPLNALSPYARSTRLLGRGDELDSLRAFLNTPKPISVRVVVGGGGSGKTRLALELCDLMQAEGWNTGFITSSEADRLLQGQNLSAWGWQKPTLVVMDYAAAKAQTLGHWLGELADRTAATHHPLRILLLERSADPASGWWASVFGGGWQALAKQALLDPAVPVPIRPLATQAHRVALLQDMLAIACPYAPIPLPVDDPAFSQQLMQISWGGDPLFLMLAAMSMAQQGHSVLTLGRTDLADLVAQGEIDRLAKLARTHGLTPELVLHLTACATLAQGLTRAAFLPLAAAEQQATGWTQPDAPAALFKLLQQALPSPQGIAPVIPDMVGEALLVRLLDGEEGQEAVLRCYAALGHRVAETVIRCVQDFAGVAAGPLGWLNAIVDAVQGDVRALEALADSLPPHSLVLDVTTLRVMEAILQIRMLLPHAHPVDCGGAHLMLSKAQANRDHHAPALASATQAVLLIYPQALQQPDKYNFHLAMALDNLGAQQSAMGQLEDALVSAQEATHLARAMADRNPDTAYGPLARLLANLAGLQARLDRYAPALATAQQAAALYAQLVSDQPEVYEPELASTLHNISIIYLQTNQTEEALQAALQAVAMQRRLAARQPQSYLPALASAIGNLATTYVILEQYTAALQAAQESVALYANVHALRPDGFNPDLAANLGRLAMCHLRLQQPAPALDHAGHGLRLLIPYFLQHHALHKPALNTLLRIYLQACQANAVDPNADLVAPLLPFIPTKPKDTP